MFDEDRDWSVHAYGLVMGFAARKKPTLGSHIVHSDGSDLSAQLCGQIWVIAVRTQHFVRNAVRRLEYREKQRREITRS